MCAIPDKEEIKGAVFQLGALKAPGPDGFPAIFFQHYWKEVGVAITEMVQHFFRSSYLLKHINHSFIALLLRLITRLGLSNSVLSVFVTLFTKWYVRY